MQSFYCQLCSKGYSRMNEYEAHLSSYDHTHRQRLKDMKAMVKGPSRKPDNKSDGLISIKLSRDQPPHSGLAFKKGGFKKAGFTPIGATAPIYDPLQEERIATLNLPSAPAGQESDTDDEGYEAYNPRIPTD